jgi:hypothetical protein
MNKEQRTKKNNRPLTTALFIVICYFYKPARMGGNQNIAGLYRTGWQTGV